MNLQALHQQVISILPLIDKNMGLAAKEYEDGTLNSGAFHYVLGRQALAYNFLQTTVSEETDIQSLYQRLAILTIDLRHAIEDDKSQKPVLDTWLKFYADAGFYEIHSFLNIPIFVEPQLELQI